MKVLKVLAWVVGTPLVLFGLLLLARFVSCGPNSADVKVATPMVEKIADYIVENGIPESLKDIPDLPYRLEGCERSEEYWDDANNKVNNIEQAISFQIDEKCYFNYKHQKMNLNFGASAYVQNKFNEWGLSINIRNYKTKTVLKSRLFLKKENEQFIVVKKSIDSYGFKHNGICHQMRQ